MKKRIIISVMCIITALNCMTACSNNSSFSDSRESNSSVSEPTAKTTSQTTASSAEAITKTSESSQSESETTVTSSTSQSESETTVTSSSSQSKSETTSSTSQSTTVSSVSRSETSRSKTVTTKKETSSSGVPTKPVGTGYLDYTFQDVDNDGKKELIEVYNTDGYGKYRIYDSPTKYHDQKIWIGGGMGNDCIILDRNKGKVIICQLQGGNVGVSLVDMQRNEILGLMQRYENGMKVDKFDYKVNGKSATNAQANSYANKIEVLYSYSKLTTKSLRSWFGVKKQQPSGNILASGNCGANGSNVKWTFEKTVR